MVPILYFVCQQVFTRLSFCYPFQNGFTLIKSTFFVCIIVWIEFFVLCTSLKGQSLEIF